LCANRLATDYNTASPSEIEQLENIIYSFLPFSYSPHESSTKNMYRHIQFTVTHEQVIMNFSKHSEFNLFHDAYNQSKECLEDFVPYSEIYELIFYAFVMYNGFCDPKFLVQVYNETGFPLEDIDTCFDNFFGALLTEMMKDTNRFFEDMDKLMDSEDQKRIPSPMNPMLLDYMV